MSQLTDGHEALEVAEGPRQGVDVAEVDVVGGAPDVAHLADGVEVVLGAVVVDPHGPAGVLARHVGRPLADLAKVPRVDRGVGAVAVITVQKVMLSSKMDHPEDIFLEAYTSVTYFMGLWPIRKLWLMATSFTAYL